ncbi:MAG TPA: hypothetical protein VEA16_14620 [Vicinamibacterales bacterium]|nr:hypothetical protein [Vicinamibacterales bacterium]
MPTLRHVPLALAALAVAAVVSAQNPGDRVEYRVQDSDRWAVGTFVRMLPEGTHALIRVSLSAFVPVQRAIPLEDIRPLGGAARPGPAMPLGPAPKEFLVMPERRAPAPTAPPPMAAPEPVVAAVPAVPGCGPRPNPEKDRIECVQQVQRISPHWAACQAGNGVACHRFVRDVARALAAGDPRWGLVTKPRGQQACTEQVCGRDVSGGYGEDMVAYLPAGHAPHQWLGSDIIGGAGAPGARVQWGNPQGYASNRPDNLWSAVPR